MCGIVGLFLKDRALEPQLGSMLTDMLVTMSDRGPDSAGIAILVITTTAGLKSPFNRTTRTWISMHWHQALENG